MTSARERLEHYLAVAAATRGNVEAVVEEEGLRASAVWWAEREPELVFALEVNEAGGVDRETVVARPAEEYPYGLDEVGYDRYLDARDDAGDYEPEEG